MRKALTIWTVAAVLSAFALAAAWSLRIREVHRVNELAEHTCLSDENTRLALRLVLNARLQDPGTSLRVKQQFLAIEKTLLQPRHCP